MPLFLAARQTATGTEPRTRNKTEPKKGAKKEFRLVDSLDFERMLPLTLRDDPDEHSTACRL